jgi:glycosyltransferase involved in cell wall biosynthesis
VSARTVVYLHSSAGRYGADRQLHAIATGLDPQRYRAVVVLAEDGELADDLRAAGVEVLVRHLAVLRRALMTPTGLPRVAARATADARALARLVGEHDAALIHTNTSVTLGGMAAARIARVPHVWHVREIYSDFARMWPAFRRLLLSADALPCVSEATRAQFEDAPSARVLHDGLAIEPRRADRDTARSALGIPGNPFVCAVLGRISPWKGQEVLIRALAQPALERRNAIALVAGAAWAGEEKREGELMGLAAQLGVERRVHLLGFRDDPETVLGAADVVVVPSTSPDPLPNSALEAAAAGCCVVASDLGGLPEIVRDGETGRLLAPGDPAALAEALAQLASAPSEIERLGRAAAADVRARFTREALLERVQALYDEVLQARAAV